MKFFIIAGEASGDLHASNLVKELAKLYPQASFRGWGGDRMSASGVVITKHIKELAFMGFLEVLKNLRTIVRNFKIIKQEILSYNPDLVILIDYPGFNLRLAKFLHEKNFPVVYYISPQVWAWKSSRVKKIKKYVGLMLVILPFEKSFYEKWNYEVTYVGHPLLDEIKPAEPLIANPSSHKNKSRIALLPGSRKQEIKYMLPVMLQAATDFSEYDVVVAGLSSIGKELYQEIMAGYNARLEMDKTYEILQNSYAALVTSGTATLETALFNVPQVVCYRGGYISYLIAKQLVDVPFISLVNLIAHKEVVKELIQADMNPLRLKVELERILTPHINAAIRIEYDSLKELLGGSGASGRAAKKIGEYISEVMPQKSHSTP